MVCSLFNAAHGSRHTVTLWPRSFSVMAENARGSIKITLFLISSINKKHFPSSEADKIDSHYLM